MKLTRFWRESSPVAISTASCCDSVGEFEMYILQQCDSVSNKMNSGDGSHLIVVISQRGVYIVQAVVGMASLLVADVVAGAVVLAAVVVAAVIVDAVLVAAAVVESRHVASVIVNMDNLESMAS